MFDFLKVTRRWDNKQQRYVYTPTFVVKSTIKDLMVRGGKFYAIFNEETGLWETKDPKAVELIDGQVWSYVSEKEGEEAMNDPHGPLIQRVADQANGLIKQWHNFCEKDYQGDWHPLNQKVIFSNQDAKRSDYCSVKLDYPLVEGPTTYYDKLCERLYDPTEEEKWEWLMGCVIAGDQRKIQKMLVFYGEPGTGKSTIIGKVIADNLLCGFGYGYATKFEAQNLTGRDSFGTQFLENDAVLAYDDDAEMNVITSKTALNKIISHEPITVNPKFGKRFTVVPNCVLIVGSNEPVQLSPNSGMNRRLIDVRPTGKKLTADEYDECIQHLPFEKSGIAWKCLQVYKKFGRFYYDHYIAEDMLNRTSPFQNFVTENAYELKDGISLAAAYKLYTTYAEESNFKNVLVRYKFRDILKLYYNEYADGKFSGFKASRAGLKEVEASEPENPVVEKLEETHWLKFDQTESLFDKIYENCPAQYGDEEEKPKYKWENVKTTLKDLDTKKLHYVKLPIEKPYECSTLIVIDLDIKDEDGKKSFEKNLAKAETFPQTYAELSKSGSGIHLHYIYTGGDPDKLSRIVEDNVECKVFKGNASLRRCLTKCNNLPIAELSSGLPLKEGGKKSMLDWNGFKNDKQLRRFVVNCLLKRHHGYTKPEMDYMQKELDRAYNSGKYTYDIRDMYQDILNFATNSTNKSEYCLDILTNLHLCSKDVEEAEHKAVVTQSTEDYDNAPIIFLDVEVAPSAKQSLEMGMTLPKDTPESTRSHFLIVYKFQGKDKDVRILLDPEPYEVEELFKYRIVAHNGIGYDSNMCYAAAQGFTTDEMFNESKKLISKDPTIQKTAKFYQARHLFWADTYEYPVKKQKLKLWEIELGEHHLEWDRSWDLPVPDSQLHDWVTYCTSDVTALEAVFDATQPDLIAKEMLAELTGGSVIDSTNSLSTKFVKGDEDHLELVYTDFMTGKQYGDGVPFQEPIISMEEYETIGDDWTGVTPVNTNHFPGYHLVRDEKGKLHNMFRGVDMGRGGYVYANPGMYGRAVTRDSASHHPSSIEQLNLFGKQTKRYSDLKKARYAIKHKDFDAVRKMFDGKLAKYLTGDEETLKKNAKALSTALKLVLNAFYGMTSSPHDYFEAKDSRNINNIVALRGAMVLKIIQDEVESRGFKVIHIKTDSIKIADPTDEILNLVDSIGKHYGYTFETEHTWNRICLVDDAQFIGLHDVDDPESPLVWDATGKKFQVPYIYKSLFTHEPIKFEDMCETFNVTSGSLHLVFGDGTENEVDRFVGNCGQFTPVIKGRGAHLYREKDGKRFAVAGSKVKDSKEQYEFLESETIPESDRDSIVNKDYYISKANEAIETLEKFGNYEQFANVDEFANNMNPPEA